MAITVMVKTLASSGSEESGGRETDDDGTQKTAKAAVAASDKNKYEDRRSDKDINKNITSTSFDLEKDTLHLERDMPDFAAEWEAEPLIWH